MVDFKRVVSTSGDGLWSNVSKIVQVLSMDIRALQYNEGDTVIRFGELRVFFDTASWDTHEDGLIYTDSYFEKDLKDELAHAGLEGGELGYSEQGMQGRNYVSFDVDEEFITKFDQTFKHTTIYDNCLA